MKKKITRAGASARVQKGLIIVNTGDGKGKTSAALGVALRATGYMMKVIMLQFFKGKWKYGELRSAPKLETFEILPMGKGLPGLNVQRSNRHLLPPFCSRIGPSTQSTSIPECHSDPSVEGSESGVVGRYHLPRCPDSFGTRDRVGASSFPRRTGSA